MSDSQRKTDQPKIPTKAFYQQIAALYPAHVRQYYAAQAQRLAFQARLVYSPGAKLVDLGCGFSPFALGLQELGMVTIMIDRFDFPEHLQIVQQPETVLEVLRSRGVGILEADIERDLLPIATASVDVVTCIHCLEHFHKSPRPFFTEVVRIVKPGGRVLVGMPNSVNLRKRLSVLIGRSNYPPIKEFWNDGDPHWHGHVREPTLSELEWMVSAAGLEVQQRIARNFLGVENYGFYARIADPLLRLFPGLCSDVFALAWKKTS